MSAYPPFADEVVEFPESPDGKAEVHLLTGINGSGKTRLLAALMAALGNNGPLWSRIRQDWPTKIWVVSNGIDDRVYPPAPRRYEVSGKSESRSLDTRGLHGLAGTGMALLTDAEVTPGETLRPMKTVDYLSFETPAGGASLMARLQNLLMQAALEQASGKPGRNVSLCRKLEETVRGITGQEFGLTLPPGKEIRLMATWEGNTLYFNELPDGLRSLLNWLAGWFITMNELFDESDDPLTEPVVLLLDEPENHLHPEWQWRVLPEIQKLFTGAQLFVATHSPFVVSALNEGWIHKFARGADGKVIVEDAIPAERGDSHLTAVQEVLGMTKFFDPETERTLAEFDQALDKAYKQNGTSVAAVRKMAREISDTHSTEVQTLVSNLMSQLERTLALRGTKKKKPAKA